MGWLRRIMTKLLNSMKHDMLALLFRRFLGWRHYLVEILTIIDWISAIPPQFCSILIQIYTKDGGDVPRYSTRFGLVEEPKSSPRVSKKAQLLWSIVSYYRTDSTHP